MIAAVTGTVVRHTRLAPLAVCAALSVLILAAPIALGAELDFLDATLALRLALVALLTGAAFVLDDPARVTTETLPISARRTTGIRMLVALAPVSVCWAVLLWLAPYTVASTAGYPRGGLVIEAFALLAWAWAVAAPAGGTRAGPFLLILTVALAMLPDRLAFFVSPGAPGYDASRVRWAVLLIAGCVLLALTSGTSLQGKISAKRH
ncbi:hypothetical protein BJY16_004628 [Actinoplanes octamycinicus]|uniref:Uncharacterized protein n=1 Tax=Actinoplanes octamycinicus TaxID=135948 RepID=A0A7W7M8R5_9ACTN|nr:hypothetical protein [Actinoplanes octamycinicus]MBB4741169.1 hypothetical protein [Actinoplanes octamycinicus]GIE56076.1 ABC transporter [Actinoplanes octamycinicus]